MPRTSQLFSPAHCTISRRGHPSATGSRLAGGEVGGKSFAGEHYVVMRQQGNRLLGQSLSHSTGSRLKLELAVENAVATGTWREQTSLTGYYRGAVYHGTLQLVVAPVGRRMSGMRLGFGRDFTINSGEWELTWCEAQTSKSVQRAYQDKV